MSQTAAPRRKCWTMAVGLVLLCASIEAHGQIVIRGGRLNDVAVRQKMVEDSIAAYLATGRSCPCPYNSASDGSSCGERSARSRPGGEAPLCYPSDVTDEMVEDYRRAGWDRN
jgi:hypothetical protein